MQHVLIYSAVSAKHISNITQDIAYCIYYKLTVRILSQNGTISLEWLRLAFLVDGPHAEFIFLALLQPLYLHLGLGALSNGHPAPGSLVKLLHHVAGDGFAWNINRTLELHTLLLFKNLPEILIKKTVLEN